MGGLLTAAVNASLLARFQARVKAEHDIIIALIFRVSEKAAGPIRGKEPVEQAVCSHSSGLGLLRGGWWQGLAIDGDVPPNLPLTAAACEASATIVLGKLAGDLPHHLARGIAIAAPGLPSMAGPTARGHRMAQRINWRAGWPTPAKAP